MKKILLITISLLLATNLLTAEGGAEFSGDIETLWGVGAPWTDSDKSAGRLSLGVTNFTGKLDAYYENSSAYAEASFSYDAVNREGGNLTKGFNLSLDELWLDYTESFWGLRIGRQKAAWGKADGIDITNVLCPSDMSSLAAMTGDDSKLAIDAIRLSLSGNQFTADAYWIPFFTPAALPLEHGNPLRKFIVPATVEFPIEALNTKLTIPVTITQFEKPELAIWNGEYGLKLSGYFSLLDVSLYGFYGWDDIPMMDYSVTYGAPLVPGNPATAMPNGLTVGGKYERMAMIGADAALPIGETVLRMEAAFFPQRYFQKKSEKIIEEKMKATQKAAKESIASGKTVEPEKVNFSEQRNQLSALAGIDWMPSGWTFTAQYYCDYVMESLEPLERKDAYQHGATLSVSKSLVNETLELSFSGLMGFNDFDSMLSPSVKYSISDQISLGLKAFIFIPGPDRDGKYGAYKDLSSICINAKFSF
ncbi:MAG: hypothetical protein K6A89_03530 [Treponema sp.]|nr:hypothetical protein [Treponema sp.]